MDRVVTYGTVPTLHYTIQAYCKPGDSVMMNTPVYDPFAMAAQRQGVQVLANPLRVEENRYQLDFNLIEEQLKTYRPTLWFFCSPHNPSGRSGARKKYARCPISVNATARFWWSMRFTLNTFWMANSSVVSPLAVPPRTT